jgi:outer membrane lipoprotein-sorting protein
MMPRIICILILLAVFRPGTSQKDPEAKKILDRVSERSLADFPIRVTFEYVYEDLMNQQTTTESGTLVMDGKKFRLSVGESEIYCDGTTVWNHLASANEVYISDPEDGSQSDDFFISNPSDLFTFYREGFKYRLTGEIEYQGKTYLEIDIFPEDLDRNYHTVKLLVTRNNHRIYSAEAFGKHGANHTVILQEYQPKARTDAGTFVFNPEDHPGVEVVDTRF